MDSLKNHFFSINDIKIYQSYIKVYYSILSILKLNLIYIWNVLRPYYKCDNNKINNIKITTLGYLLVTIIIWYIIMMTLCYVSIVKIIII
jgi:hypothetical protein